MIKEARGGGSITFDIRRQMAAATNLIVIENCEVVSTQVITSFQ